MSAGSAIRAGQLRRRITIQTPTETVGARGGPTETWATFKTRWASVTPQAGNEPFEDDRFRSVQRVVFEMRYVAGITTKMRVSWDSRIFAIQSIVNVEERNKLLRVITEEVDTSS